MAKYILSIMLVSMLAFAVPVSSNAGTAVSLVDIDVQTIAISVSGSSVRIVGGNGHTLSVFNVTGVKVMSVKVDSPDKVIDLDLPKGCYILKVGKTVRKISIG